MSYLALGETSVASLYGVFDPAYSRRSLGWFTSTDEIANIPLGVFNGQNVLIRDVADVRDEHPETRHEHGRRFNQRPCDTEAIAKRPGQEQFQRRAQRQAKHDKRSDKRAKQNSAQEQTALHEASPSRCDASSPRLIYTIRSDIN